MIMEDLTATHQHSRTIFSPALDDYPLNRATNLDPLLECFGDASCVMLGEASHGTPIGVVYEPEKERRSNYAPATLRRRYDAFLFIDQSTALHPLHLEPDGHIIPETYPFTF